jgi:hypothetical protein
VLLTLLLFSFGKLKFLLLGLTKAKTFFSMFAFFGFYWTQFGWPLAAGLVISLYIHEMGHVHMLRRLGIDAGAPLFIPGLGAFVMLKQHVTDRPGHDRRYAIDPSRVYDEIGWRPRHDFTSGIRDTVRWYLDNRSWCEAVQSGKYGRERLGLARRSS